MKKLTFTSIVFAGISLACYGILRLLFEGWDNLMWVPLGLTVIFLTTALMLDFSTVRDFLQMKTTKNGMNMGLMIVIVFALFVLVNFLGVRNSKNFDVTSNQINSLSDQSVKILEGLEDSLHFRFFYAEGAQGLDQERIAFRELIRKYQDATSKIELSYIDMNERPDLAQEFEVREGGGIVFVEYQGRRNRIDRVSEQDITASIIRVTKEKKKVIYFVEGHGEADLYDAATIRGMASFRKYLEGHQFEAKSLSLLEKGTVPSDAQAVAVIGPTQTFLEGEVDGLKEYLARGGRLFIAVDPEMSHGLESLMTEVGIEVPNNYVAYLTRLGRARPTLAYDYSNTHPITSVFDGRTVTGFQFVSHVKQLKEAPNGIKFERLVKTRSFSQEFDGPSGTESMSQGPHTLIAALEGKLDYESDQKNKYGRVDFQLVVAADSDFLRNQLMAGQLSNLDLAMNIMSHLVGDEDMISIRPKELQKTQMTMTPMTRSAFIYGVTVPLPLIFLGISVFLAIRRRNA